MEHKKVLRRCRTPILVCLTTVLALLFMPGGAKAQTCGRTITANVVAFDQVFFWNRLGTVQPQGMIFALRRDVVPIDPARGLVAGNVQLRADKRPRPMVLRMNVNDCLRINFQNLLNPTPVDDEQPATRTASVHVVGLQLVGSIASDGSNVGQNTSSLVAPGGSATYTFYAEREGSHMLHSTAANTGGEGDGGSLNAGLFGSVNVQASGARWFRSQVTAADLALATTGQTPDGHPIINYNAVYPAGHPRAGTPILAMLQGTEIVHTDINAVVAGSDPMGTSHGFFPPGAFHPTPVNPNRDQPYREFTVIYHDEIGAVQAFPQFEDPSNVHHAYLGDHTRFRIVHGGSKEHHIHHQHTHQWVHTPDDDNSTYLDSQALGPSSSFTLEMTYRGAGNRNMAVGDSIFHCHFYPHFAQGMWELYRVHDVFESGSALDGAGRPAAGTRALPDAEILAGTPIPALVPLPGLAMAPLPQAQAQIVNGQIVLTGAGNPGYPFFVPARAGTKNG